MKLSELIKGGFQERTDMEADQSEIKSCATCGKKKPEREMEVCMDSRQMHRYVCDRTCMVNFYK